MRYLIPIILICALGQSLSATDLEWIRVADDQRTFVLEESGRKFTPWGFNYDHQEGSGRLLEDYWDKEWETVQEDFQEMKQLGANIVRIHLQFSRFMQTADKPDKHALTQLGRLVKLAETTSLYLDLTGLGCYHKQDVPDWYDKLSEKERWNAQAVFWEAVASCCANSPAIFCYDLMNEPVVPGGPKKRKDWLGAGFGGKHFVQFITLAAEGRPRHEIAQKWISHLVAAIRKHDKRHLITVGLVPWSLDRPGLTSGFNPEKVTGDLDFIAMHIYPEKGKVDEAIETLKGFAAVGKPVVIEEIFPLKCGAVELGEFISKSRKHATGWIGFYWGRKPEAYRKGKSIRDAIVLSWLELFQDLGRSIVSPSPFGSVKCEGSYRHHLQGICTNNKDAIYWSFTTTLVKTDTNGKVLKKIPVTNHHGDLCHHNGKLYVAVNLGRFNDPRGNADSWVYIYNADNLSFIAKNKTPEVIYGAGGIAYNGKRFMVVGGLPDALQENYAYEYDPKFKFVKKHVIMSGHTHLGIQTAAFHDGQWWFGCYGNPKLLLVTGADFRMKGRYEFDCSLGVIGIGKGEFLIGRGGGKREKQTGSAELAVFNRKSGLTIKRSSKEN